MENDEQKIDETQLTVEFTVYNPNTREIIGSGQACLADALRQETDSQKVLIGIALDAATQSMNDDFSGGVPRPLDRPLQLFHLRNETERRLDQGFEYTFPDSRGIHRIGTSSKDMDGWKEVTEIATRSMIRGQKYKTVSVTTDTGQIAVTAEEWFDVLDAIEDFRQPIITRSLELQSAEHIPDDVTDDSHW